MSAPRHRLADRLLLVTNLVISNVAAAVFVVIFVQPGVFVGGDAGPFAQVLGSARIAVLPLGAPLAWLLLLLGIGLLVWNFTWLVRRREQAPPTHWVVSDTPSGPVRIAREALENGLRQAGEALPEVTRVRVQVDTRTQKRILVTGQFQCAEGTGIVPLDLVEAQTSIFLQVLPPPA
jgi:hypothetical protein